jgi:outer membrane protein assembly factor BamB
MSSDTPQPKSPQQPASLAQPAAATSRAASSGRPPMLPIAIVAVETVVLAGLQYFEGTEWLSPANAFLAKASTVGVTLILLFLWFVFMAPVSRAARMRVGVVGLALVGLAFVVFRVEDVSGDIVPRLRFRWSRHADQALPKIETAADAPTVNLAETTPDDYPQFLGAERRATLTGLKLARDWNAQPPKKLWSRPIGAAWSSFAVVGPYAVTQEQRGEEELVACYDLATGKPLWAHSTPVRFEETLAGIGPRATPTIHEGKVYTMGAKGHLACLDGATGKTIWQHDVVSEFAAVPPIWGKSCSPLVYEDKVIVSAGAAEGKSLVAFNKNDGALVWSGGGDSSSYSSPTPMTLCGVPQIVIANSRSVASHDPASGRVLWQMSWPPGALEQNNVEPMVAQPVAIGDDRILITKGYGTGSAVWKVERENDEADAAWHVAPLWRANTLKTKFTNPVIRDGYAYALDEGVLECVDLNTGDKTWKRGKYGHGQVLLVDDLLLVQSEDGDIALVEADPKAFRELARHHAIEGTAWNPPALAGRKLLVRSNIEAACYELPATSP